MDESHLTGEAEEVAKTPTAAPMALAGSKVVDGRCNTLLLSFCYVIMFMFIFIVIVINYIFSS